MKNSNVWMFDSSKIKLVPISDLHFGSSECNMDLVKRTIELIEKGQDTYGCFIGDLIEVAGVGSIGREKDQSENINDQISKVVEMFKPIKHKILFGICGNHEYRTEKQIGLDVSRIICEMLEVQYCKWEKLFVLGLRSRKNSKFRSMIKAYAHHGTGGGSTTGGKINSAEKLHYRAPTANLILSGHTHIPSHTMSEIRDITSFGVEKSFIQHYVVCGTTHKSDGYAAMKAYRPQPTVQVCVSIELTRNDDVIVQSRFIY